MMKALDDRKDQFMALLEWRNMLLEHLNIVTCESHVWQTHSFINAGSRSIATT